LVYERLIIIIKIRPVDVTDFSANPKIILSIKSVCFMFGQFSALRSVVLAVVYISQWNFWINIRYVRILYEFY